MPLSEDLVKDMHKALSEFGYPVDLDYIRREAERLTDAKEKPIGGPSMFIMDWLEKGGLRA